MTVNIFDLDGSVTSQPALMARLGDKARVVDLRDLAPSVRCLPTKQAQDALDQAVASAEPRWLSFYGSGDFHHLSASVLRRFTEPLSVVVFDQHSDWIGKSIFPCGAWLIEALKLPSVARIVSIGVGSTSIGGWKVNHGTLKDLLSGRVELYPYDCKFSRCMGRRGRHLACAEVKSRLLTSDIYWKTIADSDWQGLIGDVIDALPTESVYLSIDKDCLNSDSAFTNWDSGPLTLDQLTQAMGMLRERTQIVGADICGEYSEVKIENQLLEKLSDKFHPKLRLPRNDDLARNEQTNIALLQALGVV
jgi:arginase family enzyme